MEAGLSHKFRVGLALGGGGVRGFVHIGVLKVFHEQNIPIDLIVGTSIGALIGGFYALNMDPYLIEQTALRLLEEKDLFRLESLATDLPKERHRSAVRRLADYVKMLYHWNLHATRKWLVDLDKIEKVIKELVGDKGFKDTKVPFYAIATDANTGKQVILKEGGLAKAILASSSIPGIFPPVDFEGRTLLDGGILGAVPAKLCRKMGGDLIIGINTEKEIGHRPLERGLDVLYKATDIRAYELNRAELMACDVVIEPRVGFISWAHFSKSSECIMKGEEAARQIIPKLKKLIQQKRRRKLFKSLFGL